MKARADVTFSELEKMSSENRKKFGPIYKAIEKIIKEIDEQIDQLQRECPDEWTLQKNDLDGKLKKLKKILETSLPAEAFIG